MEPRTINNNTQNDMHSNQRSARCGFQSFKCMYHGANRYTLCAVTIIMILCHFVECNLLTYKIL